MNVTFALREFFKDRRANLNHRNHFLLAQSRVEVTLVFEDSTEKVFVPPRRPDGKFLLEIGPNDIPESVAATAPPLKKGISSLSLDYTVPFTHAGKTFQLLRIFQDFSLTELPSNSDQNVDYALSPFGWKHSAFSLTNRRTSALRTANARAHPLLDLTKLAQNLVMVNSLMLDVTELWNALHEKNINYRMYKVFSPADRVTFKVFAHLGGNAFIWYSVVPSYLAESTAVSPHVFYSPADYAEKQNIRDERKYLLDNAVQFEARTAQPANPAQPGQAARPAQPGSEEPFDGTTLLMGYLLPPIDDDRIPELDPPAPFIKQRFIDWATEGRRNVVNFHYTTSRPRQITPNHWNLGAGFERAFYGLGETKPQQFLLMPQVIGRNAPSAEKGWESDKHLKNITDTIVDLLQTNTELIGRADDELVAKDKMVLSCYSESGFDLWKASTTNMDNIKAIIGIEPNSTNPKGRDIIPKLLAKKIRVFIIGRHQGFNDHYRPKIAADLQDQIRFLPDKPREVLKYPPDPDVNDFVKYRVSRVTDVTLDPLMLEREKVILTDLANERTPVTGKAAIPRIFRPINNSDNLSDGSGVEGIFYSHNFALTGGQDMKLADPVDFYGKPVAYRTFFQQAVEEIG